MRTTKNIKGWLSKMTQKFNYLEEPLKNYIDRISAKTPVPGGGSVTACVASFGAGLLNMVLNFTLGRERYAVYQKELEGIKAEIDRMLEKLTLYIEEDSEVYSFIKRYSTQEKNPALQEKYLRQSVQMHLDICDISLKIIEFSGLLVEKANPGLISDTGMSAVLGVSAFKSAKLNILINLKYLSDKEFVKSIMDRVDAIENRVLSEGEAVYRKVSAIINFPSPC